MYTYNIVYGICLFELQICMPIEPRYNLLGNWKTITAWFSTGRPMDILFTALSLGYIRHNLIGSKVVSCLSELYCHRLIHNPRVHAVLRVFHTFTRFWPYQLQLILSYPAPVAYIGFPLDPATFGKWNLTIYFPRLRNKSLPYLHATYR